MTAAEIAARDQQMARSRDQNRAICIAKRRHWYSRINPDVCLVCGDDRREPPPWWSSSALGSAPQ